MAANTGPFMHRYFLGEKITRVGVARVPNSDSLPCVVRSFEVLEKRRKLKGENLLKIVEKATATESKVG